MFWFSVLSEELLWYFQERYQNIVNKHKILRDLKEALIINVRKDG